MQGRQVFCERSFLLGIQSLAEVRVLDVCPGRPAHDKHCMAHDEGRRSKPGKVATRELLGNPISMRH